MCLWPPGARRPPAAPAPPSSSAAPPPAGAVMSSIRSVLVPLAVVVLAAGAAFAVVTGLRGGDAQAQLPAAGPAPVSAPIEAGYGLRFQRATLAMQGGLVDVRFTILDTLRAEPVIGHLSRERVKLVD